MNYYNEFDPFAAAWLRELIKAKYISNGEVDERSIKEVQPKDLMGYKQCHFFAGIGVWSYALRSAEWPDDRPVWTGSCPCQPFSAAGKKGGFDDERHLWPEFFRLIRECQPLTIFGEQVASKDGLAWLDLVSSDLERENYTFGAVDTCAAGFGAPHIRQRLYWVADSEYSERRSKRQEHSEAHGRHGLGWSCAVNRLAYDKTSGRREECEVFGGISEGDRAEGVASRFVPSVTNSRMGYASSERRQQVSGSASCNEETNGRTRRYGGKPDSDNITSSSSKSGILVYAQSEQMGVSGRSRQPGETNGYWQEADWIPCIDRKVRPVESGTFPLANGIKNRVGLLRGYGNALVAPQAQAFVEAFMEIQTK